jgi:hypothetical protein
VARRCQRQLGGSQHLHPPRLKQLALLLTTAAGTGLRNVRGLLRRPQATVLVQKMQNGELRPGEVQGLLEKATDEMKAAEQAVRS